MSREKRLLWIAVALFAVTGIVSLVLGPPFLEAWAVAMGVVGFVTLREWANHPAFPYRYLDEQTLQLFSGLGGNNGRKGRSG